MQGCAGAGMWVVEGGARGDGLWEMGSIAVYRGAELHLLQDSQGRVSHAMLAILGLPALKKAEASRSIFWSCHPLGVWATHLVSREDV